MENMKPICTKCYSEPSFISTNNLNVCAKCIGSLSRKKYTNNCESYTIIPAKLIETQNTCWIIDSNTVKSRKTNTVQNPITETETEMDTLENNLCCNVCYETPFFIQMDCCSYTTCIQCSKMDQTTTTYSNDPIHCMHCQQEYRTILSINNPYSFYFTPNEKYGILIHQERLEQWKQTCSNCFYVKFIPITAFIFMVFIVLVVYGYYVPQ